jgi:hypothetical protein
MAVTSTLSGRSAAAGRHAGRAVHHLQPVAAGAPRLLDRGRLGGGRGQGAAGDALVLDLDLVVPAAVGLVPDVLVVLFVQLVGEVAPVDGHPIRTHGDHVEAGGRPFRHAVALEARLDADGEGLVTHGQHQLAADRPAADVEDAGAHHGFQWAGAVGAAVQLHLGRGLAVVVGGEARQVGAHRLHLLLRQTEAIAGLLRIGIARGAQGQRQLARQVAGRRAEQVMRVDGDLRRVAGRQPLDRGADAELQARRHEVVHQQVDAANRRTIGLGVRGDAPGAGEGAGRQVNARGVAAGPGVGERAALHLEAVRAQHLQRQRLGRHRVDVAVAQQHAEVDRLAGPVDAAFGVEEGVQRTGRRTTAGHAVGHVEARHRQIEEAEIGTALGEQRLRRLVAGSAKRRRVEAGDAVRPGGDLAQFGVVAG